MVAIGDHYRVKKPGAPQNGMICEVTQLEPNIQVRCKDGTMMRCQPSVFNEWKKVPTTQESIDKIVAEVGVEEAPEVEPPKPNGNGRGNGAYVPVDTRVDANPHPLLQGLVAALPPVGVKWTQDDRAKWMLTAESIFDLLYKNE